MSPSPRNHSREHGIIDRLQSGAAARHDERPLPRPGGCLREHHDRAPRDRETASAATNSLTRRPSQLDWAEAGVAVFARYRQVVDEHDRARKTPTSARVDIDSPPWLEFAGRFD